MSGLHSSNVQPLPQIGPVRANGPLRAACVVAILLGAATFFWLLGHDAPRAWHNYLLNYFYWLCLGLGGAVFIAIQYLTGSVWSVGLRRTAEALVAYLPLGALLFGGLVVGGSQLYDWTNPTYVAAHAVVAKKAGYLNWSAFAARHLLSLVIWIACALYFVRNSLRQDRTKDAALTQRNTKVAAAFMIIFALSFTLACFDLLMSLDATWFSTIFGVYGFAGLFLSTVAMMTIIAVPLYRGGHFGPYVRAHDHLFDLGKLMFAFTVFWAYIAFSQFMLIWYADLPEETGYLIQRMTGHWTPVSWGLLIFKFILPFLLLLSQDWKKRPGFLFGMALWVLAAQYLDIYWLVFPHYAPQAPVFGWTEVGIFLGFAGMFGLCVTGFLSRVSAVPVGDPRLHEALEFHQ